MSADVLILPRVIDAGTGRCDRCSRVTELLSGRTVTGVERDMCAGCWAPDSCRVVDHPGEMGPHQDAFCTACGALASVDQIDTDGWCEKCAADDCGGYTSRGDAHLMAVTAPGAR